MAEEGSRLMYVPEELEEQILIRLPVKSIVRFKSVCKRWHSLFCSKAFEEFYFGLQDKEAFIPTTKDLVLTSPELKRRGRRSQRSETSVMGPLSNGIYALTSFLLTHHKQVRPHVLPHTLKIALFNPATRQIKFAAPFPNEYLHLLSGISSIDCSVYCGIDDACRVVVLIKYSGGSPVRNSLYCYLVFLYTWKTGEWEKLVHYDPFRRRIGLPCRTHVFKSTVSVLPDMMACSWKLFNGCWHWITNDYGRENGDCFGVLSFDFERKSLGKTPGPPCEMTLDADLFVLQDHLAAVVVDCFDYRLEIWRKTTTTWTNVYKIVASESFPAAAKQFLHSVDYYQEAGEEEPESIKIKSLTFILREREEQYTFDEQGDMIEEFIDTSNPKISLNVGGISNFTPTFELLPCTPHI